MTFSIAVDRHPLLRAAGFVTRFPRPLGEMETSDPLRTMLSDPHPTLGRDETLRTAVRDLLRSGGYKPTGRGKPASEYLVRGVDDGRLGPINLAVDACNAVSLHSGFPVSVVDLALARPPFRIALAPDGAAYVFNRSGQEIDLGGLLCLFDADGPCANAVKDSQRTKTRPETESTLSIVWGVAGFEDRVEHAVREYRRVLAGAGATTVDVEFAAAPEHM